MHEYGERWQISRSDAPACWAAQTIRCRQRTPAAQTIRCRRHTPAAQMRGGSVKPYQFDPAAG